MDLRLHPLAAVWRPYTCWPMVSGPESEPERAGQAPSVARTLRWTLPLALVAIGFLVAVTLRSRPGPGLHGDALAVSAALVFFAASLIGFERAPPDARALRLLLLGVMMTCASTLFALQSDGPGFLMMLPPVSAVAFRFPRQVAVMVTALGIAALAAAAAFGRSRRVDSVIVDELAVAAYFGVAAFAGRFIVADEQSQALIAQLAQTRLAEARAAALAERQRLAREMHDVLAHSLSGLVLNLESARLMTERGLIGPELQAALGRSHSLAKTGLEEARRAIGTLRDDDLPGPSRLAALANDFEADTGVPCRVVIAGEERDLASDCQLTVYRATQEALTNIRKHACAESVDVRLTYEPDGTRLVVEDHGKGPRGVPPGGGSGYGLTGMRERAELLGGTLVAGKTADGFRVELWTPS